MTSDAQRTAAALKVLEEHYRAFNAAKAFADETGHTVPCDTKSWSEILVATLSGLSGRNRMKGSDLSDGSDVKAANTWSAIDTPRFNGAIPAGRTSATSKKPPDIGALADIPYIFFVLWDEKRDKLLWYAAYLTSNHGWKFSFGRMATSTRISRLSLPAKCSRIPRTKSQDLLPKETKTRNRKGRDLSFSTVPLAELFRIESGDFHSVAELSEGIVPLISCGALDNGIIGFYDSPANKIYRDMLTVAYNGDYPLMAKFHPYEFAAKDDVALLHPHRPMRLETTLFVQLMLNREVWRHSYGRKLYWTRMEKFMISMPTKSNGTVDEVGIASWLRINSLWSDVGRLLDNGLPRVRRSVLPKELH